MVLKKKFEKMPDSDAAATICSGRPSVLTVKRPCCVQDWRLGYYCAGLGFQWNFALIQIKCNHEDLLSFGILSAKWDRETGLDTGLSGSTYSSKIKTPLKPDRD
jgi:hypothetical protein